MASDSIFADPRAAFGPESRPLDWNKQGMGARDIGGLEMAGGGGTRFGWGVSVEVPSKSPSAAASACSSAGDKRRVRGPSRSQSSASVVIGGVCAGGASAGSTAPVDDPVVVKNLTSQVEASSITTRNGAIQREMQDAYRKLICANVERKLTLQDVASFSTFLVGVRVRLHEKGSNLRRRHSVLSSLLKHAPRARVQRIYSDLAAVEEQESALTKDVDLFNKLQQDLKESPAYKAMMEYGHSSGMVNVDGTMMPDPSKHPELEAMASMSVKDMLAEFKMEDKRNERQNSGRAATQPGDARIAGSGVSSGGGGVGLARSAGGGGPLPPPPQKSKKGKKGKKDRRR